jgi:DNA helicase-2/ATP-dependent DNA helicase PcrA
MLEGKEEELSESVKIKINSFRKMLSDFKRILEKEKPSESLKYIIKASGLEKMYNTDNPEDTDRLENIMELVTLATAYDLHGAEEGIEKFLTDSSLASDQDSLNQNKNGVKLMTVHASKGLEFEYVFISGLESDLFPHHMKDTKRGEDGEEERRLFYVALTRAKRKLYLTFAETRTIFGSLEINSPSEFIEDIPEKYLERESYGVEKRNPIFSIDF